MDRRGLPLVVAVLVILAGCSDVADDPTGRSAPPPSAARSTEISTAPATTTNATTTPPTSAIEPPTSPPRTDSPTTAHSTTIAPTTSIAPGTTAPEPDGSTPYIVPLRDVAAAGWGRDHSGYPATDIFAACGAEIVSPVQGVLLEVRTVDSWDPAVDDPASRGGRSVSVLGDDGVRYYVSHLDEVGAALVVGGRVDAGQRLGTVGLTGRTSACHVHFGISPPCPDEEWSIRRGVIPPAPYLDAWRSGEQSGPRPEVEAWTDANPEACAEAAAGSIE